MADDRVHSVYGTREEEIDRANRWQVRAEKAEATIAEQAKEIERLREARCCESCGRAYPWHAVGCHFCPEGNAYDAK